MKQISKTILVGAAIAVTIFGAGFFAAIGASAEDWPASQNPNELVVEFNLGDPLSEKLFDVNNFLPGDSRNSSAYVENNIEGEGNKTIAIEAINVDNSIINDSTGERFGDALNLKIEENTTPLFEGTLTDFFNKGEFVLSDLNNGANTTYNFLVTFKESVSEEYYQEKNLGFDVIIGFQGEDDNGNAGGGGSFPPGLTILDESVRVKDVTGDSATILWTTSYFSTSQVIYAAENESYVFDVTQVNYGYPHVFPNPEDFNKVTGHEVTINGLTSSTTYYFRCVSHASPPTVSRSHTFTTLALTDGDKSKEDDKSTPNPSQEEDDNDSGGISPEAYQRLVAGASNFIGNVLGFSFEEENENKTDGEAREAKIDTQNSGKVKGDENKTDGEDGGEVFFENDKKEKAGAFSYWWWPFPLALILIILLLWYRRKKKKEDSGKNIGA